MPCSAMGITMKLLITTVFLMVSLCTGMRFVAADPEIAVVWSGCGNSGNNKVLDILVNNIYANGFNTSSIVAQGANSNSTVYGLVQCRGDLDSSDCRQCASTAKANLVQGYHNTYGFIQLDGCFLRYDDHNLNNDIESTKGTLRIVLCNTGNSSQPQQFTTAVRALLSNSTAEAQQSPKFFAADSVAAPSGLKGKIYSLAQCSRALSRTSCGSCLTYAVEDIFKCQSGALGAQIGSQNCYLRYEVYELFNIPVLSQPPGESTPVSSGMFFTFFTLKRYCF